MPLLITVASLIMLLALLAWFCTRLRLKGHQSVFRRLVVLCVAFFNEFALLFERLGIVEVRAKRNNFEGRKSKFGRGRAYGQRGMGAWKGSE